MLGMNRDAEPFRTDASSDEIASNWPKQTAPLKNGATRIAFGHDLDRSLVDELARQSDRFLVESEHAIRAAVLQGNAIGAGGAETQIVAVP